MKLVIFFVSLFLPYSISIPTVEDSNSQSKITEPISTATIELAALGRVADLGDLYDVRTDNFVDISLYNLSGTVVRVTDTAYSTMDYVRKETLSEKADKLGISASLTLSILGELASGISASGKYLKDDKKSAKSAKTSLVYKIKTKQEHLNIFSTKSKEAINRNILTSIDATHVVVGIEWGANVVLSLEESNTDSSNAHQIQGKLDAAIKAAAFNISAPDFDGFYESEVESSKTFSLHLNGDIIPDTTPRSIKESIAYIRNIPKLIKNNNNGKGKILKYTLMPLITVEKVLKNFTGLRAVAKEIENKLVDQFMKIFQEIKDSQLKINDVYNDINQWALMFPESDFETVSKLRSQFETFTNDIKLNFSSLVVQFRSGGDLNGTQLKKIITNYKESNWIPENIDKLLALYKPVMQKIRLLNLLEGFDAMFVNRRTDQYNILANNYMKEVRIISIDLGINISSINVRGITRLLQVEAEKISRGIQYYIEDNRTFSVPNINVYIEGGLKESFPVAKKEYIILISEAGNVTVMNANSYEIIRTFQNSNLSKRSFAIIDDTLYVVNSNAGLIETASIANIITKKPYFYGLSWTRVGSFPSGTGHVNGVNAVNGSTFYFVTYDGLLYRYDTKLKTATKSLQLYSNNSTHYHSLMLNGTLYIYRKENFYSIKKPPGFVHLNMSTKRIYPGLLDSEDDICVVGGEAKKGEVHPLHCYIPNTEEWYNSTSLNEGRRYPGVVKTSSGIIVFGGKSVDSEGAETHKIKSAEFFNHKTRTWSYITTFPDLIADTYAAFSVFL